MKTLLIQTAFIGDAILLTAALETLHAHQPDRPLDILVRKGTESLFSGHPFVGRVLTFDKRNRRTAELSRLLRLLRAARYDRVFNFHRFASTGVLTLLSGARQTAGFRKNPLSVFFSRRCAHLFDGRHETERNHQLLRTLLPALPERPARPRLYPRPEDYACSDAQSPYICLAPASVWFTKQYPAARWKDFLRAIPAHYEVHILGAPNDYALGEELRQAAPRKRIRNQAGKLGFLASAALMEGAAMNYVNDSAPLHLASAVNAPVTAIFCSTVPEFGFTPRSERAFLRQYEGQLACRPCGLHGHHACPEGHFRCAEIPTERLLDTLPTDADS